MIKKILNWLGFEQKCEVEIGSYASYESGICQIIASEGTMWHVKWIYCPTCCADGPGHHGYISKSNTQYKILDEKEAISYIIMNS